MTEFVIPKVFKESSGGLRNMTADVIHAEAPCGCSICKGGKIGGEQLHITLTPTDQPDWKPQHEWFGLSESEDSAMTALIKRLRALGVPAPAGAKITDILSSMKGAKWAEEEGIGQKKGSTWMPVALK